MLADTGISGSLGPALVSIVVRTGLIEGRICSLNCIRNDWTAPGEQSTALETVNEKREWKTAASDKKIDSIFFG
jgi:hypothetical protein